MNDTKQKTEVQPLTEQEEILVNKIISLKATDLILDLIKQNRVKKDDEINFIETFLDVNQRDIKRDVKVETVSLWLVKHGYGALANQFKEQLSEFLQQEVEPLINSSVTLNQLTNFFDD